MPFFPCLVAVAIGGIPLARADDAPSPRQVAAWPAGPIEVRLAFDRPIKAAPPVPSKEAAIAFGDASTSVGSLRVAATRLEDDGRTLVLLTDPHPFRAEYRLAPSFLRSLGVAAADSEGKSYGLSGVEASWTEGKPGSKPAWSGWWPALDTETVALRMRGSIGHERAMSTLLRPGHLTLRTLVSPPRGKGTLRLRSSGAIEEPTLGGETAPVETKEGGSRVDLAFEATGEPIELIFDAKTGAEGKPFKLESRIVALGGEEQAIPSEWLSVSWSPPSPPKATEAPKLPSVMEGGDAKKGEVVFFSENAKCSVCHAFNGKGGAVGPDLSNVRDKGAAYVYQSIVEPSARILPDYVTFTVTTRDGRVVAGTARAEGSDRIQVIAADAKATAVLRSELEEIRPSATSIMPVGLPGAIGESGMRDLMAYLLAPKP